MIQRKNQKYKLAIEKELKVVKKQEESLRKASLKAQIPKWKETLEEKVPENVYDNLLKAFGKAFSIIFEKGTGIIEKSYNQEEMQKTYEVQNYEFQLKGDRKFLKKFRSNAGMMNVRNMAITTAEGVGLGVLGIGLPDIVIFVGMLLKGIYEIAIQYGFEYDSEEERYFILTLMETALLKGEVWEKGNARVNQMLMAKTLSAPNQENMEMQIHQTANAFAVDMVLLKFVQGLPIVGAIGGAGNPVYYHKVMKYAELKYRKRHLLKLAKENG